MTAEQLWASFVVWNYELRYRKLMQISRKQHLLCWHRPSRLVSKGWALRTKGSHLMYPCKQVKEAKSQAQPTYDCMWLHWLFHFPSVMLPSCFNSLSFISLLCYPFPLSHCQNTVCLFFFCSPSFFLHYSSLWSSDPPRVKEYHLDLEVCIFYRIITCVVVLSAIWEPS
jgi:hypothetical protein